MSYDLADLPLSTLFTPVAAATQALVRLDERAARSTVGAGWVERAHFADAVASLWVDGELVMLEDLVLHDAGMGVRAPTHELTIAHDVLRTRRRIAAQPPGWALSSAGLAVLRGSGAEIVSRPEPVDDVPEPAVDMVEDDPLADHFAAIDAVLARSEALLSGAVSAAAATRRERDPLVYEPDWDEDARLDEWRGVLRETADLPPVLRAALALDAWNSLDVLQHAPWLGRLLAAAILREGGVAGAHLAALSTGLKSVRFERRRSRDRTTRLLAILEGFSLAADTGLKEHNRLLIARQQMERRLEGRRQSSRLPDLIDLVLSRPLVSSGMVAADLGITPRAALKIAGELNLRELTGRGRFRAWGVL